MPTIINNPSKTEDSGTGLMVGVLVAIIVLGGIALFFVYGLPIIQNNANANANPNSINVNIKLPNTTTPSSNTTQPSSGY